MISFQLDENLNSKKLANRCNSSFPDRVCRYPNHLMGATDPEMLQQVLSGEKPLITLDRSLPHEHIHWIPEKHPGIIVIFDDSMPSAMTAKRAESVIELFKKRVRNLNGIQWKNHIFEVSQNSLTVYVVKKKRLVRVDAGRVCDYFAIDFRSISKE